MFISIMLISTVLLITVGYSAFASTFFVTNSSVRVMADVNTRITSVTSNSNAISNLDYNVASVVSTANISSGSSVTFQVTVTTYGNVPMALSNISVLNGVSAINGVTVTPNLTNTYVKICDSNDVCTLNVSKVIDITITNNTASSIVTDNLNINLTFTPFYTVTYNNSNFGDVLQGGTFTHTFLSNVPSSVTVSSGTCGTPQMLSGTLTIENVMSNLVLSGSASSGSGTRPDPYVDTSQTYSTGALRTGYTLFSSVPGAPLVNATTETVNGQTVTTVKSFEFTSIDTDGIAFGSNQNSTLNTNVSVIDETAFSIHMKFRTNLYDNKGDFILSAIEQTSDTTYSGFSLNVANSDTSYLQFSSHINRTYSGDVLNATQTQNVNSRSDATSHTENEYEVVINYTPGGSQPLTLTYNGSTVKLKKNSIPSSLSNAKITIGGNGINNNNDVNSLKVLEFQVCKGTFDSNYICTPS